MNSVAQWIGYAVMTIGGVALVGVAAWCVIEFMWQQWKRADGLRNIQAAFRDAHRWRYFASDLIDFVWSPEGDGTVKWVRYLHMPEPDVSAEGLTRASAVEQLAEWIDRQPSPNAGVPSVCSDEAKESNK